MWTFLSMWEFLPEFIFSRVTWNDKKWTEYENNKIWPILSCTLNKCQGFIMKICCNHDYYAFTISLFFNYWKIHIMVKLCLLLYIIQHIFFEQLDLMAFSLFWAETYFEYNYFVDDNHTYLSLDNCFQFLLMDISTSFDEDLYANCRSCITESWI